MAKNLQFDCQDCGRPTVRDRRPGEPLVCINCGITRAAVHIRRQAQERQQRQAENKAAHQLVMARQPQPKTVRQRARRPPSIVEQLQVGAGATVLESLNAGGAAGAGGATIGPT